MIFHIIWCLSKHYGAPFQKTYCAFLIFIGPYDQLLIFYLDYTSLVGLDVFVKVLYWTVKIFELLGKHGFGEFISGYFLRIWFGYLNA